YFRLQPVREYAIAHQMGHPQVDLEAQFRHVGEVVETAIWREKAVAEYDIAVDAAREYHCRQHQVGAHEASAPVRHQKAMRELLRQDNEGGPLTCSRYVPAAADTGELHVACRHKCFMDRLRQHNLLAVIEIRRGELPHDLDTGLRAQHLSGAVI